VSFWAYLLHCDGGYFYVGHTDDLERRFNEHQSGAYRGYTFSRRPVKLVWSQEFQTRDDAKAAEAQLKGWSRAKKLALIRGDWDRISALASAKKQGSPSTSSGTRD
jgi:predicted GIY-YIG superfamily endonuclease